MAGEGDMQRGEMISVGASVAAAGAVGGVGVTMRALTWGIRSPSSQHSMAGARFCSRFGCNVGRQRYKVTPADGPKGCEVCRGKGRGSGLDGSEAGGSPAACSEHMAGVVRRATAAPGEGNAGAVQVAKAGRELQGQMGIGVSRGGHRGTMAGRVWIENTWAVIGVEGCKVGRVGPMVASGARGGVLAAQRVSRAQAVTLVGQTGAAKSM